MSLIAIRTASQPIFGSILLVVKEWCIEDMSSGKCQPFMHGNEIPLAFIARTCHLSYIAIETKYRTPGKDGCCNRAEGQ